MRIVAPHETKTRRRSSNQRRIHLPYARMSTYTSSRKLSSVQSSALCRMSFVVLGFGPQMSHNLAWRAASGTFLVSELRAKIFTRGIVAVVDGFRTTLSSSSLQTSFYSTQAYFEHM